MALRDRQTGSQWNLKAEISLSASSPTESTIDRGVDFRRGAAWSALLPGTTATDFWDIAGVPVHRLPAAIVRTADDVVDAALAGLDQGEVVTIRSLADKADWDRYEATRRATSGKLSSVVPAPRYNRNVDAVTQLPTQPRKVTPKEMHP
jgi:hypothetical protein